MSRHPPHTILQWLEFGWLVLVHPAFRRSANKRRTYFEHCLAKQYHRPFS